MSAMRHWFQTLRLYDLFSWPVFLGAAAEFNLVLLASPYNAPGNLILAEALQLLVFMVGFGLLGAMFVILHKRISNEQMRIVLLTGLPVCALIAGALLGWLRLWLGLDPTSLVALRMFSAAMHITAVTVLLWMAVSGVRLHYARMDMLFQERYRLESLNSEATHNLDEFDEDAVEVVRVRILDSLTRPASNNVHAVLAVLTDTIEDTVRPLSRQLESDSSPWIAPTPILIAPSRIDWKTASSDAMSPTFFSPLWILVIGSFIATPMNLARVGVVFSLQFLLLTFLIALPVFCAVRFLFVRRNYGLHRGRRAAAFLAMCLLGCLVWAVALLAITLPTAQPLRFFYLCPIFTTIIAYIWGFAVAAQQQAKTTEVELMESADNLSWQIARSQELHRQRQRALAHAVHGEVQAALSAGILELDRAAREGTVTDDQMSEVRNRILKCVENLDLRTVQPSPLNVVASKVHATWSDVVSLDLTSDPELEVALASDPQCLMTLNDVIPELVFNSIKHGNARHIAIVLEQPDSRTLRLSAQDDGIESDLSGNIGMGSRLLDACAIEWKRERQDQFTLTSVTLPFAPVRTA